jgi:hypothetical protein
MPPEVRGGAEPPPSDSGFGAVLDATRPVDMYM